MSDDTLPPTEGDDPKKLVPVLAVRNLIETWGLSNVLHAIAQVLQDDAKELEAQGSRLEAGPRVEARVLRYAERRVAMCGMAIRAYLKDENIRSWKHAGVGDDLDEDDGEES